MDLPSLKMTLRGHLSSMWDPKLMPLPGHNLTRREREVVMALMTGASNREIGQALYVTETTVKQHVSQAMRKLGARNRTQLAVMYLVATHDSNGDVSPLPGLSAPEGAGQEMRSWPGGTAW